MSLNLGSRQTPTEPSGESLTNDAWERFLLNISAERQSSPGGWSDTYGLGDHSLWNHASPSQQVRILLNSANNMNGLQIDEEKIRRAINSDGVTNWVTDEGEMQPIFEFHGGHTYLISGEAKHWIGLLPHALGYGNGGLPVGRKFKSLAQFEVVAEEISS